MIKSVITAAGKGIRLLPTTYALPKEMLPIFRFNKKKRILVPLLQVIFMQQFDMGIRDFCFVVGREKKSIENHFTLHHSYLKNLNLKQKSLLSNFYKKLEKSNISWVKQNSPLGFGDAVRQSERFVGNDDFIVHAGDVNIVSKLKHPIVRMIETAKNDSSISAVFVCKKVKDTKRYGVPKIHKISNSIFRVEEVEEKPRRPKSNFAIMPLYFFKPKIFDCLKKIKKGKGGEYQLTDAIQKLIETGEKVVTIPLLSTENEIDVGTAELYKKSLDFSYKWHD